MKTIALFLAAAIVGICSAFTTASIDGGDIYVQRASGVFELKSTATMHGNCIESLTDVCNYVANVENPDLNNPGHFDPLDPDEDLIWQE